MKSLHRRHLQAAAAELELKLKLKFSDDLKMCLVYYSAHTHADCFLWAPCKVFAFKAEILGGVVFSKQPEGTNIQFSETSWFGFPLNLILVLREKLRSPVFSVRMKM